MPKTEPTWQPIETAPKDRRLILLIRGEADWVDKYDVQFGRWIEPSNKKVLRKGWCTEDMPCSHVYMRNGETCFGKAVAWMHVPEVPNDYQ